MNAERVKKTLRQVRKTYEKILDPVFIGSLHQAEAKVDVSKKEYDYAKRNQSRGVEPTPWGYSISHEYPLRFKPSTELGLELQVDIYCDIKWAEGVIPVTQDIKVRVWSTYDNLIYDPNRDAKEIEIKLTDPQRTHSGRVVTRFHLDLANPNQKRGPTYHIQYGGKPEEYELCWHPKSVNIPRLVHQPMELFLTCQMVAANFFWDEYISEIRPKREWRDEVLLYEDLLLRNYYKKCLDFLDDRKDADTLLDYLWVV